MLGQFDVNRWQYVTGNVKSVQPAAAYGTSVTPTASSADPSTWTEILSDANVTADCYFVAININSHNGSAAIRELLVDIGIDTSGGTSYVTLIPSLLASDAGSFLTAAAGDGGHWYFFPLFIPSGSAIASRGRGSNASAIAYRAAIWLFGKPSHPHLIRWGTRVEAIGIDTANSTGTTIVAGTVSEGSWTSLGTSSNANFFWQVGYGANNTNVPNNTRLIDLAYDNNATTPNIILEDVYSSSSTTEKISLRNHENSYCFVPAGSTLYGRIQESAAPVATQKMSCYGVS